MKAGARGFTESKETWATCAASTASACCSSGALLHESSRHNTEKTTGTWGRIVIQGKRDLKETEKKIHYHIYLSVIICLFSGVQFLQRNLQQSAWQNFHWPTERNEQRKKISCGLPSQELSTPTINYDT